MDFITELAKRGYNKGNSVDVETLIDEILPSLFSQQERSYSDMQEYATFCIECDRKEMPLLLVQDWYKHYKK